MWRSTHGPETERRPAEPEAQVGAAADGGSCALRGVPRRNSDTAVPGVRLDGQRAGPAAHGVSCAQRQPPRWGSEPAAAGTRQERSGAEREPAESESAVAETQLERPGEPAGHEPAAAGAQQERPGAEREPAESESALAETPLERPGEPAEREPAAAGTQQERSGAGREPAGSESVVVVAETQPGRPGEPAVREPAAAGARQGRSGAEREPAESESAAAETQLEQPEEPAGREAGSRAPRRMPRQDSGRAAAGARLRGRPGGAQATRAGHRVRSEGHGCDGGSCPERGARLGTRPRSCVSRRWQCGWSRGQPGWLGHRTGHAGEHSGEWLAMAGAAGGYGGTCRWQRAPAAWRTSSFRGSAAAGAWRAQHPEAGGGSEVHLDGELWPWFGCRVAAGWVRARLGFGDSEVHPEGELWPWFGCRVAEGWVRARLGCGDLEEKNRPGGTVRSAPRGPISVGAGRERPGDGDGSGVPRGEGAGDWRDAGARGPAGWFGAGWLGEKVGVYRGGDCGGVGGGDVGELCSDVGNVERSRDIVDAEQCGLVRREWIDVQWMAPECWCRPATERYGVAALVASAKAMVIEATSVVLMVDSGVLVMGSESEWKG